jgi:hypothetical protein
MNPFRHGSPLAGGAAAAAAMALVLFSCSPRKTSTSYLDNSSELSALAEEQTTRGTAAAFVLWCTDTARDVTPASGPTLAIPAEELAALRAGIADPSLPATARIIASEGDIAIAAFLRSSPDGAAAPVWMSITVAGRAITAASLSGVPDQYDILDITETAVELMKELMGSGEIEGAGLKAVQRLDPETYPNLAAVRNRLSEVFTDRTVESVIRSFGLYERERLVWMQVQNRSSGRLWDRVEIDRVVPSELGFLARLLVPLREDGTQESLVFPFVLTCDGWRIDQILIP